MVSHLTRVFLKMLRIFRQNFQQLMEDLALMLNTYRTVSSRHAVTVDVQYSESMSSVTIYF